MKSAGWYFKRGAQKVYVDTMEAAQRLAQEFADSTRRKSAVGYDAPRQAVKPKAAAKRKPAVRKITARRNGDAFSIIDVLVQQEKGKAARREFMARTKGKRLAKSLRYHDPQGAREAGREKTGKFKVTASNRKEAYTLFRASRTAANQLAQEFTAAGFKVAVSEV